MGHERGVGEGEDPTPIDATLVLRLRYRRYSPRAASLVSVATLESEFLKDVPVPTPCYIREARFCSYTLESQARPGLPAGEKIH